MAGGDADGDILQCSAIASHGMPFKMGQHQEGIIIGQIGPHIVDLNPLAIRDGQRRLARLIHDVHLTDAGPAVLLHGSPMLFGGIALSLIGGVAFHYRAGNMVNDGL